MSNIITQDAVIDAVVLSEDLPTQLLTMNVTPFLDSLDVSVRSLIAYRANVNYFINWYKECKGTVIEYKKSLKARKLKSSTINAYLTAIRRFFRWLYEEDIVQEDYSKKIKAEKMDSEHKRDAITDSDWLKLVSSLDLDVDLDLRDYLLLLLGANYGLRSIEIVRLNKSDVIRVGDKWALNLWRKGYDEADKKPRPISDEHYELLLLYAGELAGDGAIFKSLSNNASHSQSERLSTSGIRYAIRKRLVRHGISSDRISYHSLRHYAITSLIKKGVDILQVRDFADHKSVTTTEIYIHTANRFDNPVAFQLDLAKPTINNEQ